jgi:hypothetical protein
VHIPSVWSGTSDAQEVLLAIRKLSDVSMEVTKPPVELKHFFNFYWRLLVMKKETKLRSVIYCSKELV